MKHFLLSVIRNTVLVNVLLVIILLLGAVANMLMIREVFPEISVDMLMVSMAYPGADPEDVEEGISRKIEEAIDGIEGIKRYTTVSSENFARAPIEIIEGYPPDKVVTEVRNAIDSISTFPPDAEKPILQLAAIKNQVIFLSLWGDQSERVLKEFAEDIKDELQAIKGISQVSIRGTREYEIGIEVSEERLRGYGLTFADVASAVRRGSLNLSGGELRTLGEEIRIRTVGRKYTGDDFASIVVMAHANGEIITLDKVADIRDDFVENEVYSSFNGKPAVTVAVFKTQSEDSIQIAKAVREYAQQKDKELPEGLNASVWSDQSGFIQGRLDMLFKNGMIGLAIVFLSLWLFLEIRLSFWVTMGIPISLSGGLLLMYLLGSTLNTMSMFGLIMVLGIVVDDAIIVGEAIYVHRRKGDPPLLAAANGVMEVGLPVLAAVTTSIIAFLPLLFVDGVMGKFVKIIPVAVVASLVVSLIESLFLLPAHLNHLPDLQERPEDQKHLGKRIRLGISHGLEWFIEHVYIPFLDRAIHFRYVTASVAVLVLLSTVGLLGGGFVKFVLFPDGDQEIIEASIEFPRGTPPGVTRQAITQIEESFTRLQARLASDGEEVLRNYSSAVGQSGGNEFDVVAGNHVGSVRIELTETGDRTIEAKEIAQLWEEETGPIPGALSLIFGTQEMGPPGAPIQISISGNDIDTLLAVSDGLKAKLRTYDGVYQIEDSYRPGKNEIRLDLKPEARTLGIQLDDLARQVYAGYFGEEAVRLQRGRDDIRVRVRYTRDERSTLAQLEQVRIRTPQGDEVPLFSVANVSFGQGDAAISRVDGRRSITVLADSDPQKANPTEVLADMNATILPELASKYPGWTWEFWGAQQQSREAFQGLAFSFPIALVAMFVVIAAVFRSYVQPLMIMMTVPFGIIGAVWGHFLMGLDLAMFSIFGMVALTGVVVNDAIVLIEAINKNIAEGVPIFEAIKRGGGRRFRAIMLTTVSTIGGLLPLILESGAGGEVVVGMALSLASGVAFATVLTLIYVPCLFGILSDFRRILKWTLSGFAHWPTREEVEPARLRNLDPLSESTDEHGPSGTTEPIIAN